MKLSDIRRINTKVKLNLKIETLLAISNSDKNFKRVSNVQSQAGTFDSQEIGRTHRLLIAAWIFMGRYRRSGQGMS